MPIAFLLATLAAQAAAAPAVLDPPAAIALAEAHPERANSGTFRMTVAATDRNLKAVFLNSTPDYRGADDVTFSMRPIVAKMLEKRYGQPPETYLKGRTVTVRGRIRARPIANLVVGRPRSLARYQHTVEIDAIDQIVAID